MNQKSLEEMCEEIKEKNEVYYRLMVNNGEIRVVHMQWHDEYDYNQNKFITDDKWDTEAEAEGIKDRLNVMILEKGWGQISEEKLLSACKLYYKKL